MRFHLDVVRERIATSWHFDPRLALLAGLIGSLVSACDTSPTPHPGTLDASPDTVTPETGGDANELSPDLTPPDLETDGLDLDNATPDSTDDALNDVVDGDTTDDTDVGPDPLPTEPATVDPLAAGPWRWVVIAGPQTLVASDGDGLVWFVGEATSPIVHGPGADLPSAFMPPAAAALSPTDILLGGASGLTRLVDGVVVPSPLTDYFASEPISALSAAGGAIWLSTDTRLYRWKNGELTPIEVSADTGPDLAKNLIAALPDGAGAWLAGPDGTALLTLTPPTLTLERPSLDALIALSLDVNGHLYALDDRLQVRSPGALAASSQSTWREAGLPGPTLVAVHPQAPSAWVLYDDGAPQLARGAGTTFARVTGLPPAFSAVRHLAAHADGRLIAATATGLFEVSSSRTVSLPPLPTPLTGLLVVTARASDAAQLVSATATASATGGSYPLEATLEGLGAERRVTVRLDPLTLPNGPLTLTLSVTWADAESKSTTAPFAVDEPTWTRDVSAFYEGSCKNCHAADNGGNFASLHTPERWSQRMDEILCRVDQHDPDGAAPECDTLAFDVATMPPGRAIAAPQVQLLRRWRDAGYRP